MSGVDRRGRERSYAVVLKPWEDTPAYHAYGDSRPVKVGTQTKDMDETACGRPMLPSEVLIPVKHAKKFGRPCQQCWQKDQET